MAALVFGLMGVRLLIVLGETWLILKLKRGASTQRTGP